MVSYAPNGKTYCPYCDKYTIEIYEKPGYVGSRTSRGSGQSHRSDVHVDGKFKILSGCSECGKSIEDVKKWFGEY